MPICCYFFSIRVTYIIYFLGNLSLVVKPFVDRAVNLYRQLLFLKALYVHQVPNFLSWNKYMGYLNRIKIDLAGFSTVLENSQNDLHPSFIKMKSKINYSCKYQMARSRGICSDFKLFPKSFMHCTFFFWSFWWTHTYVLFWGHLYPCFGFLVTSPLGFKARMGSALFAFYGGECNVHSPRSTSGATHANLLAANTPPVLSPHPVAEVRLPGLELVLSEYPWVRRSTNWAKPGPIFMHST